MANCPFKDIVQGCTGSLSEKSGSKIAQLKRKTGVDGILKANKIRGIEIFVEKDMFVHAYCRKRYINTEKDKNAVKKIKTEIDSIPSPSLRSKSSRGFKFETHCIMCETIVVDENGKKIDTDVHQVQTTACQKELLEKCDYRLSLPKFKNGDQWTEDVRYNILWANALIA